MNISIFGDSITSGENNNFISYVDKLKIKNSVIHKHGISGTTIGDYSLYPVKDYDLIHELYKYTDELKESNIIILEYGCNDISAVCAKNTTLNIVVNSFIKGIDYIKQINNNCKIYFISLGENIELLAKGQCNYLNDDYLKYMKIKKKQWIFNYKLFINSIYSYVDKTIEIPYLSKDLDIDNIHPNDKGYELLANKIMEDIL